MKPVSESNKNYLAELEKRARKSRVHRHYQLVGLNLAEILKDPKHKALYIKLAKQHNSETLLRLARGVAERSYVKNRGAYFMKLLKAEKKDK